MHNSSNPGKNYFQHAVAKNEFPTAVSSKKYCNSIKMSNILRTVPQSHDHAKPQLTLKNWGWHVLVMPLNLYPILKGSFVPKDTPFFNVM